MNTCKEKEVKGAKELEFTRNLRSGSVAVQVSVNSNKVLSTADFDKKYDVVKEDKEKK